MYLQHVPASWAQTDISKLGEISNTCFTAEDFQSYSKLALFDDDLVISDQELEVKKAAIAEWLKRDELLRLSNMLSTAQDRKDSAQVRSLSEQILWTQSRTERESPFIAQSQDMPGGSVPTRKEQKRERAAVAERESQRRGAPVHRDLSNSTRPDSRRDSRNRDQERRSDREVGGVQQSRVAPAWADPGDWYCDECTSWNWARRTQCYKCFANPKPQPTEEHQDRGRARDIGRRRGEPVHRRFAPSRREPSTRGLQEAPSEVKFLPMHSGGRPVCEECEVRAVVDTGAGPVSYTHLTLPTKRIV
eukprot:TRINITY_DN8930_c0_g1_i1.p1 TRINITY_DN8930_c0_g1~~TRINITY_DN8930_c0_g1_i1.p1  ORF type:complete len:304 (+),score=55.18 TRINITY_DN8930_c0_g1_i1:169-1080(+)